MAQTLEEVIEKAYYEWLKLDKTCLSHKQYIAQAVRDAGYVKVEHKKIEPAKSESCFTIRIEQEVRKDEKYK